MEEAAASLQTPVFAWDGDEERFAMERVHGVNDYDDDDQTNFSTMNEVNGDDDWRALAASQPPPEQPAADEAADMETSTAPPSQPDTNSHRTNSQEPVPFPAAAAAASASASAPRLQHTQVADIRIMRFTRKRTPHQRGRRHPSLTKPSELLDKFPMIKELQQEQQEQQDKEAAAAAKAKSVSEAASMRKEKQPVSEIKAKPSADEADKRIPSDKRSIRTKQQQQQTQPQQQQLQQQAKTEEQQQQQQQSKKQKTLAFQKSRNMINKRINGESAKAEPGLDVDCAEVAALQAKQKAVASDLKSLREEIRAAVADDDGKAVREAPSGLQERWIELHCSNLRSNFDFHFAVAQHFLCHHPPSGQCKAPV